MITNAGVNDKNEVYEIWKHTCSIMDRSELNHYFKNIYDQGSTIVVNQDDRIISTIHFQSHVMTFKKKRLCMNYLLGMATLPDYRMRGHMGELMDSVMDESSHRYLFTVMKAFHPQLYEKFGFETVCWHKQYHISAKAFSKIDSQGVSRRFTAQELLGIYEQFTAHFDGYMIRDLAYYEQLIQRSLGGSLRLCVFRNEQDEIRGYAFYQENETEVEVREIMYLDSVALGKMLRFIIRMRDYITVNTSTSEKLEKMFPMAIPKRVPFLMAKLHQKELFNKLYGVQINNAKEAFQLLDKPMYYNEDY